jgi:hypothetical protein
MDGIVILGSLDTNRDPTKRIHVFESAPLAYTSLEEAIQAAKADYWKNIGPGQGAVPQFRVYESSDPDGTTYALIEVTDKRGDMTFVALYKIIAGKYGLTEAAGLAPQETGGFHSVAGPTQVPAAVGVPPHGTLPRP